MSKEGVFIDPAKIQAIIQWPTPKNMSDFRSFVGLAGYHFTIFLLTLRFSNFTFLLILSSFCLFYVFIVVLTIIEFSLETNSMYIGVIMQHTSEKDLSSDVVEYFQRINMKKTFEQAR